MSKDEFMTLVGQDIVVYYPFWDEVQQWNMKNFYIDENGEIKHNRFDTLNVDVFIAGAVNPHKGKATHG